MVFQATAVYPTGMTYLIALPSLLCGLAVSAEDLRRRRVPRLWIAVGCIAQCAFAAVYGVATGRPALFAAPLAMAVAAGALQLALALVRPGALGFGDVTATLMVGQAVGLFGPVRFALWWLAMGVLGLLWMWAWRRFDPQRGTRYAGRVPFVPAIVAAGVLAVL